MPSAHAFIGRQIIQQSVTAFTDVECWNAGAFDNDARHIITHDGPP
jgi:hypothetical protein